jgi:hypothetical protein
VGVASRGRLRAAAGGNIAGAEGHERQALGAAVPIRIVESSEPLSPAAQDRAQEALLIDSDASRLLSHEMLRYCDGEVTGRSFLIAGHRGAGKTTMVSNAHLQAKRETARRPRATRPLIVWLHGPSLFPQERAPEPKAPDAKPNAATAATSVDGCTVNVVVNPPAPSPADAARMAPPRTSDTALALEQITLALHRAVAREFAAGFHRKTEWLISRSTRDVPASSGWFSGVRRGSPAPPGEILEMAELAASFERELYESPDDARLREYWRRVRALRRGVLFPAGSFTALGDEPADWMQGSLELAALSGVSQAYRRISGKYEMLEAIKDESQSKSESSFGIDSTAGKLFAPITSLLTGGLVGAGLLAADASGPGATVAGILAALGASLVFKASSSRSRAATTSREQKFIFDLSATTLDRILPILIERVRRAGLAPIFIVDELDKVDQLSRRILGMVHHLKKLVAENAFFAFLTDRTYFERLSQRTGALAYPVEYTYYTHLVFVSFTTQDFHEYLSGRPARGDQSKRDGILQLVPDAPSATPPPQPVHPPAAAGPAAPDATQPPATPNVAPSSPVTGEMPGIQAQTTASADDLDLQVLPYFLLHRAQLHPLDLKRQLSSLRDAAGLLAMRRGQVRGEGYRLDVQMQVAIEMMLDRELIRAYLTRDPDDRRLVHDAMYYLTRRWKREEEIIDLSESGTLAFSTYLSDRIGTEGVLPEPVAVAPNGKPREGFDTERMEIDDTTREFLLNGVRSLAAMLADHDLFERYLDAWNAERLAEGRPAVGGGVRDTLQLKRSTPLLRHVGDANANLYGWNYDRAGLELIVQPAGRAADEFAPPSSQTDIDDDIRFIREFAKALGGI